MKKCLYCAEKIQDDAVICRYCKRKVRPSGLRRIIVIVITLALAYFFLTYQHEIKEGVENVGSFFEEIHDLWGSGKQILKEVPKGLESISEYRKEADKINKALIDEGKAGSGVGNGDFE